MNQYGRPGRADRQWGKDTIEGDLSDNELLAKRHDQTLDNLQNRFMDQEYYSSRDYDMSDIEVPLLSVGNWGGILLHLRGNVEGFMNAGSRHKYLRFVTGRHDLPFYTKECVELQRSFLDAFLKDIDPLGWKEDKPPKVGYKTRVGDVGFNNANAEAAYTTRYVDNWPVPDTEYIKYHLSPNQELTELASETEETSLSYKALGNLQNQHLLQFVSQPFEEVVEFTGHIVAHLNVSITADEDMTTEPKDMDLFLTVRHLSASNKEILYTGTTGDPVPVTRGWLRVSLRKVNEESPRHKFWHPHREYKSTDYEPLIPGQVYAVDIEIWPSNVVMSPGDRLVFEVSSGDTQGAGLFEHNSEGDRDVAAFGGLNHIHFGKNRENWLQMPRVPAGNE